jgi:glycosyltransferase involved in cell wall biosynthesis
MVTFVVPTKNSARTIEACLRSIRSQTGPAVELVVVDNFSTDDTPAIAADLADVFIAAGPERSAQRNIGARAGSGPFIAFIDSDMVLEPRIASDITETFRSEDIGALVLPEFAFGTGFLSRSRALEKQLYIGDPNVEAARVFRREIFEEVGGYDEALHGGEDWELPERVRSRGSSIGRTVGAVWHDEGRIVLRDTFRKKIYYGRSISDYLAKSTRPGRERFLRTGPLRQPRLLFGRPHVTLGLVALKATETAGLLTGMVQARRHRRA